MISILMSPHSNSFSGALIGSSDLDLFQVSKERGFKKFTKWSMFIFGFIFLLLSLLIRLL
nr:preprotein translocase subunit SecG [Mycoplasma sp. 'Moose RK']